MDYDIIEVPTGKMTKTTNALIGTSISQEYERYKIYKLSHLQHEMGMICLNCRTLYDTFKNLTHCPKCRELVV